MGDIEEVQEQMKVDMLALKDQMASMMEAMLSMKRMMESNAAVAAAANAAIEADPTHPSVTNQAHQPILDMVGQGGEVLGSTRSPHMGYNRNAYPYGLPPQLYTAYHAHAQRER